MNHKNLSDLETFINKRGISTKTVVSHKTATIKNLIMKPNETIPPHQVPVDVTFFILSGSGTITIGKSDQTIVKNDIILCPPNTPMSLKADDDGLTFLNIKTPGIQ
ncbi:MAG: cupin domain-containing protein [Candidatus Izemoplasma sp.]|nr:cupin domain-containing protein [Candidatus Izemoplasma sp.]